MNRAHDMLRVASRARLCMQDGDAADVVRYVRSRMQPDGGFSGRSQASDLYYTIFGCSCLLALGERPNPLAVRRYLKTFGDGSQLDFVHAASLARGWAALPFPLSSWHGRTLLPLLEAHRAADGGYNTAAPAGARGTVYGGFLAFLAYRDNGAALPRAEALFASVAALRAADGGYANSPDLPTGTTTATAAAILLGRWLAQTSDPVALAALLACECPAGGFLASPRAPAADLLSTATALFALRASDARPARSGPHLDFVESLWDDSGGFSGHLADPVTDCEYTFYALLALGCLHEG